MYFILSFNILQLKNCSFLQAFLKSYFSEPRNPNNSYKLSGFMKWKSEIIHVRQFFTEHFVKQSKTPGIESKYDLTLPFQISNWKRYLCLIGTRFVALEIGYCLKYIQILIKFCVVV